MIRMKAVIALLILSIFFVIGAYLYYRYADKQETGDIKIELNKIEIPRAEADNYIDPDWYELNCKKC